MSINNSDNGSINIENEADEQSTKEDDIVDNVEEEPEESQGSSNGDDKVSHSYNLRGRGSIHYKSMHRYGETQLMQIQKSWIQAKSANNTNNNTIKRVNMNSNDLYRRTNGSLFTQLSKVDKYAQVSVNEGIQRHGDKTVAAVLNEFAQLNDKGVFKPRNMKELKASEKSEDLNLITMVKEKRDGKIKGRACADGRKQRRYISIEMMCCLQ